MIWVVIVVLVLVCIVSAIIYNNHTMKMRWEEATNYDTRLVREACEHSRLASNTPNVLLALREAERAFRTLEILVARHGGIQRANEITGQDLGYMLEVVQRQSDKILEDTTQQRPELLPADELRQYYQHVRERQESRQAGVPHLDGGEST